MLYVFTFAKKGSERIPYKNIKKFLELPLIEHTFKHFSQLSWTFPSAKFFCVSDFEEIENISRAYRVKYIDETKLRSKTFNKKIKEVFRNEKITIDEHDVIVLLQPTSPIRFIDIIISQIRVYTKSDFDLAFSVYPVKKSNYYYDNKLINADKDIIYQETGSYYFFNKKTLELKYFMESDNYVFLQDSYCIDLDEVDEWNQCELILKK